MRAALTVIALPLAALFVAATACAERPDAATLQTGFWRLQSMEGDAFEGETSRLVFDASTGRYSASLGCNQMGGAYALSGDRITFSEGVTTLMGCPEPIAGWEGRVSQALQGERGWRIDTGALILSDAAGAPLAVFVR
jgi:heat shock protein HslJ